MAYPYPTAPPAPSHPEMTPGVWHWTAASQPSAPTRPTAPTPASPPSPKLVIAYALFLALGTGVAGVAMWNAGVAAGESGSAAKVAALESQADATNARIENFCQGAQ
ncbi:MAG: hypothetical protein AAGF75_01545 [Cyanobacteria bacterium P01_H01_bin.130]